MSNVLAGGGRGGFRIEARAASRRMHFGWDVTLRAFRVKGQGANGPLRLPNRRVRLGDIEDLASKPIEVWTRVPQQPAFYRLDIEIRDLAGNLLSDYSEYLRVLRSFVKARLTLNSHTFDPGDVIFARVENAGSTDLVYGAELAAEAPDGNGGWSNVPGTPTSWPQYAEMIGGGAAGSCERLRLPTDLAPGGYRISKHATAASRSLTLRATFQVK
jgi:hypothetical protein